MNALGTPALSEASTAATPLRPSGPARVPTRDLGSRAAIHDLVVRFYREIVFDELLEPMFSEVAEVDWSLHLPKLTDYWCRVLLGERGYDGFLLAAHRHVHDLEPLTHEMFDRWYRLWVETIDSSWSGPIADTAKRHAAQIGSVLAHQTMGTDWTAFPPAADPVDRAAARAGRSQLPTARAVIACGETPGGDP